MSLKQSDTIKDLRVEIERLRRIENQYLKLIFRNDELISETKRLRKALLGGKHE